jgi:FkbM family methyltransferase
MFEKIINFIDIFFHMKRIANFLNDKKIDVIFDIGSHKGEFLKTILKLKSIRKIYCFEPQIRIFKTLKYNFSNIKGTRIIFTNCAIGRHSKNQKIFINKLSSTSSLKIINKSSIFYAIKKILLGGKSILKDSYSVKVIKLDDFLKNISLSKHTTLIKIDTEGAELDVLNGVKKNIKKIKYILIEKQFFNQYKNVNFNNSHAFLSKNNFKLKKKFIFPLLNFEDRLYTNLNL